MQTWGLQIDRHVQRNGYEETWTPARKASASFIAQSGTLTGLTGMRHGQIVELNPGAHQHHDRRAVLRADESTDWSYASKPQLGGNVRWAMGSNFVLNGTVKPDFSQVEADATQIAADERFALFYPEKRPFFVEALDQFNVPNQLVYTRTIVQPDAAGKLTGKLARADVASSRPSTRAGSWTSCACARRRRAVAGGTALQRSRRRWAQRTASSGWTRRSCSAASTSRSSRRCRA